MAYGALTRHLSPAETHGPQHKAHEVAWTRFSRATQRRATFSLPRNAFPFAQLSPSAQRSREAHSITHTLSPLGVGVCRSDLSAHRLLGGNRPATVVRLSSSSSKGGSPSVTTARVITAKNFVAAEAFLISASLRSECQHQRMHYRKLVLVHLILIKKCTPESMFLLLRSRD